MTAPPSQQTRVTSIDVLRGLAIVLMALDHTREFFHYPSPDPLDLAHTTVPLFMTRWVTHLCAPVFMFLAGVGAALQESRGRTRGDLSRFLVTRGLVLAALEISVVRLGWFFNVDYHLVELLVIWALGWSMVVLAGLIWVPRRMLALVCLFAIAGHNLLDGVAHDGRFGWIWRLLHAPGAMHPAPGFVISVGYVLLPWAFVMALGYCCGPVFAWPSARRRRALLWAGALATMAFVVVRSLNGYGDPSPWSHQRTVVFTAFSFLNSAKYPPSLCYLLMTLGPGCVLLGLLERWNLGVGRILLVFGRVPLFLYVVHLPAIHLATVAAALLRYGHAGFLFRNPSPDDITPFPAPPGYGYSLWVVYAVWIVMLAALYPLCRWFARYKRTHRAAWLSYV